MPAEGSSATLTAASPQATSAARHALLLLVLINLFNYIDRQVLAAVEPEIRAEFFPDVIGPDGKPTEPEEAKELTGFLSFAFLATYMFTAPLFGAMATRVPRWWLISAGVGVWSLASGASGLAPWLGLKLGGGTVFLLGYGLPTVYLVMLATRCFVGLGEAAYGPVAPDIISDLFPVAKRGQVLAWFYAAIPFGGALGYSLGAMVNGVIGDWRWAFYVVVPPGLMLAAWCALMPEPARGQSERTTAPPREAKWSDYMYLLKTPSYALNTFGMTFMCFAMGGLAFWAPGYLRFLKVEPVFGKIDAVMFFGILTAGLGLLATLAGGMSGDALRARFSGSYFLVSGAAMLIACPMLLLMVALPFPWAWLPLAGFVFCLFFNTGPTNTILANVVHPSLRARGFALNILIIHLLGDAVSPWIMGKVIGNENHFNLAFQLVAATVLVGGILWVWGARYLQRDTELAPTRLPPA